MCLMLALLYNFSLGAGYSYCSKMSSVISNNGGCHEIVKLWENFLAVASLVNTMTDSPSAARHQGQGDLQPEASV